MRQAKARAAPKDSPVPSAEFERVHRSLAETDRAVQRARDSLKEVSQTLDVLQGEESVTLPLRVTRLEPDTLVVTWPRKAILDDEGRLHELEPETTRAYRLNRHGVPVQLRRHRRHRHKEDATMTSDRAT